MTNENIDGIEITWFGHATWRIRYADQVVWVDPFLDDNPSSPIKADQVDRCDTILLTHGHFDHIADVPALAQKFQPQVVANYEIVQWLSQQHRVETGLGMNTGGRAQIAQAEVKLVQAIHSSSLPDGSYGGLAGGFLFFHADKTIYFAGDTAVFSDMSRLAPAIDLAVLPIGDLYTMGPEDSVEAIELLRPRMVVPGHYNTWPPIAQDGEAWRERVEQRTSAQALVPKVGEAFMVT